MVVVAAVTVVVVALGFVSAGGDGIVGRFIRRAPSRCRSVMMGCVVGGGPRAGEASGVVTAAVVVRRDDDNAGACV